MQGKVENVIEEQRKAGLLLGEMLQLQKEEHNEQRRTRVDTWLGGTATLNGDNYRHQRNGENTLLPGAGDWLIGNPSFQHWFYENSDSNPLWINGNPGSGKSIICARAVMEARTKSANQSAAVAFHYYSFDEDSSDPTSAFKSIAAQLFHELIDLDDISDSLFSITKSPCNEEALKEFIQTMIMKSRQTYVFLDGIDEELQPPRRWENAKIVLGSQDRPCIRDQLRGFQEVVIDETTNGNDIEAFFEGALRNKLQSRFSDSTSSSAVPILNMLKAQVHGNFLWADMMVKEIRDAISIKDLKKRIKYGLPEEFKDYLSKQVRNLRRSSFVVNTLSILTYAKRPLSLEELCEAIEAFDISAGDNIGGGGRVFEDMIEYYCAPLIRIDEVISKKVPKRLCRLCHSSVKEFLVRNPRILENPVGTNQEDIRITSTILAESCLKYLQQTRFSELLRRTEDDLFVTSCGEDILQYHFLIYCARYWGQHLGMVPYSPELGDRAEQFLRSRNFVTCLQVQSLFIVGYFSVRIKEEKYIGMEAFPDWLSTKHCMGAQLYQNYQMVVKEWGYLLDSFLKVNGLLPGQLSRCLWGTLGTSNFLHRLPSEFKSFALEVGNKESTCPRFLLDQKFVPSRSEMLVFWLENSQKLSNALDIVGEKWVLSKSRPPTLREAQKLTVQSGQAMPSHGKVRYDPPRELPSIILSDDGRLLQISSTLYFRTPEGAFQPIESAAKRDAGCVQLAYRPYVAVVASRYKLSDPALKPMNNDSDASESSEVSRGYYFESSQTETTRVEDVGNQSQEDVQADWDSLESCSIREHMSDAFSEAHSDEISELDSDFEFDDKSIKTDKIEEGEAEEDSTSEPDSLSDVEISSLNSMSSGMATGEEDDRLSSLSESSLHTCCASSFLGVSSEPCDPLLEKQRKHLRRHLGLGGPTEEGRYIDEIQVFRLNPEENRHDQTFHLSRHSRGPLIDSPPVIHPYEDLVVWPNGAGEVVFGDFNKKTYFTMRLSYWCRKHCLISVQGRFSPCGQYMHFASLFVDVSYTLRGGGSEGYNKNNPDWSFRRLHVTTHRLSRHNPTQRPPHLVYEHIFRSFFRGAENRHEGPSTLSLGFTLTWADEYLFLVFHNRITPMVRILRIPLFQVVEGKKVNYRESHAVSKNDAMIFLPKSSTERPVYYFPFPATEQRKHKSREGKEQIIAMLFLSSHTRRSSNAWPNDPEGLTEESPPPQIVFLTASQLASWTSIQKCQWHWDTWKKLKSAGMLEKLEELEYCKICGKAIIDEFPYTEGDGMGFHSHRWVGCVKNEG
ncbi:hypothetical protein M434DRAFT_38448 [Hypoxylon sp. CO27-5]|nr:hypothetical protein M434DRAFT_38448 [Hypoxylon sp. CO27-5]